MPALAILWLKEDGHGAIYELPESVKSTNTLVLQFFLIRDISLLNLTVGEPSNFANMAEHTIMAASTCFQ